VIKPLIIANVIVFCLTGFGHSTQTSVNPLLEMITLHPIYIRQFQLWRLGTYMFAHAGWAHLIFNMWGLYIFGARVEQKLGGTRFLRLYLISGLFGGLAWLAANWWQPTYFDVLEGGQPLRMFGTGARALAQGDASLLRVFGGVIGASGCVFGVMMAAAMTFPNDEILLLFPPIPMKLKTLVIVFAGIEVMMAWEQATGHSMSKIAHLAHLGGIVGAFFYLKRLGHRSAAHTIRDWFESFISATQKRARKMRPSAKHRPSPAEVDRILDKIGQQGMDSLTPDERKILEMQGRKLKDRDGR
jgi:membrane associated rhomboid family serine protease